MYLGCQEEFYNMKVLLAKPVDKLGETGEVVEVAAGYARNYLFPKRFAVEPTPHNVKALEKATLEREAELRNREEAAKALKTQLDGATFTFQRTAQEGGHLYGSVRLEDIATAVAEKTGHELERDRVKLEAPIETVGTFHVTLSLYKDITSEVTVVVEAENAPPTKSEAPQAPAANDAEARGQAESETQGDAVE